MAGFLSGAQKADVRSSAAILFGSIKIVSRIPADVNTLDRSADRATHPSGRDGEEALEVGAFGEADGVVDGVTGAVDLSQGPARVRRRPIHRREEVRGAHPAGARSHDERAAGRQHTQMGFTEDTPESPLQNRQFDGSISILQSQFKMSVMRDSLSCVPARNMIAGIAPERQALSIPQSSMSPTSACTTDCLTPFGVWRIAEGVSFA